MTDEQKSKQELIQELDILRQRVADLDQSELERKRAEQTQGLLVAMLDATPGFVGFADAKDTHILYINPAGRKMVGVGTQEDVTQLKIADVHPEWTNKLFRDEIIPTAIRDGIWTGECAFLNRDGREISVMMVLLAHKSPSGDVERFSTVSIEITERKRAEEALRFKNLVFDASIAANSIADLDGVITEANDTFLRIWGYLGKSEVVGKTLLHFLNDPNEGVAIITALNEKGEWEGDYTAKKKDGSTFIAHGLATVVRDENGKLIGYQSAVMDITERKQAEEALRRSKEFGETVLNSIEDNISIIDVHDYRIMGVNQSFLTRLGLKEEEAIGKFCYEVTHHRNSPCIPQNDPCPLWETLKTGKQSTFEHIHYSKDGEKVYVEVSATPIKNEKGEIIQVVHVGRDITAKKLAEEEKTSLQEQLRQSQKMEAIGQLAGGIAHDFNNLLTVIRGYSQLSLNEIQKHDPLCENIEEIEKAANRASELTRQLLAFSRRQLLEVKVIDMNVLIQGMEKMLRRMIRENIELIIEPGENLGKIKADPGQIEQVILNLAVNAKDAMPSEGRLILKMENSELDEGFVKSHLGSKPGQYVRLRVTDTGIGMPPEVREKVFEPFFTTKEKGKGTGLGLSTVYGIVKQSEGYIWVSSELGRGTSIEIYLPRVEGPLEEMREKIVGEVFQGHETILIVEDEEVVRKLAVRVLKKQGYKVLEASDGGKAFMLCEEIKEPIHLILTDVVMPGMSGSKLVERLKVIHPEMKALYMSGYADNAIVHHGVLEQGIHFIQKPFNVDGLARKVREVLDK